MNLTMKKYNKAPNKNIWGMPASIIIVQRIIKLYFQLQKPYYSLKQTPSENYGGIGAVMAMISHAFDNNG